MNRESQTAPPKTSHLGVTILLLIFLITIIFYAWQWADKQGHIVETKRTLAEYLNNVDFFGKLPRQRIAEVQTTAEETQRQLDKLSKDVISTDQLALADQISHLIESVDALPLAMDTHLVKVNFPLEQLISPQDHRWYQFINEIGRDLQQLIRIQKIDDPAIELLSPSQRDLIRENIKLRLRLAQYSLLTHDQTNFQTNLELAINLIHRHYDKQTESVIDILNELNQLQSYSIGEALSKLSTRNYRLILDGEDE